MVPTVDLDGDANGDELVYFLLREFVLVVFSMAGSRNRELVVVDEADGDDEGVKCDEERRSGERLLVKVALMLRRLDDLAMGELNDDERVGDFSTFIMSKKERKKEKKKD